jgi:glyoxylase-like metal-dependent hydrolase (beta-lactamase superfamily II)
LIVSHVLCTHHHIDHVQHNAEYKDRFGCPVCGHGREREWFRDLDEELEDGDEIEVGELRVRAIHVPGHTAGQLAFLVNEERVFTGDTLFYRTVGGTRGPGHTTFEEIRDSILEKLMRLPAQMPVYPGHSGPTTIGDEWDENPFIRIWRGLDAPGEERCQVLGQPATLLLRAPDYDGGTKCWVRFDEADRLDIVAGSQVLDVD